MGLEEFDPRNITQAHMDKLADNLTIFMDFIESCAVFPDDVTYKQVKSFDEAKSRVKKLIKKLRKGDRSVFKDEDDWNPLS